MGRKIKYATKKLRCRWWNKIPILYKAHKKHSEWQNNAWVKRATGELPMLENATCKIIKTEWEKQSEKEMVH